MGRGKPLREFIIDWLLVAVVVTAIVGDGALFAVALWTMQIRWFAAVVLLTALLLVVKQRIWPSTDLH